ncbi:hypothetical protein [uncultured Cellulomonas sp.]|uniref:hypothetical protein n=1 Tax=uncultured Cellulomonas sp. TaxID=189682 RepID=UPI0028EBCAF7|nr:hypothetical protein [uncultured Cellulomonas sp.]
MDRRVAAVLVVAVCAACAGPVQGVQGRLVGIDDTGLSDHAIEEGWVAALPGVTAADLWPDLPDGELRYAAGRLEAGDVTAAGGVVAPVGGGGRFSLDVPAGPTLVCWARGTVDELSTSGCGELDLPEDGRVRATFGEGGFSVSVVD